MNKKTDIERSHKIDDVKISKTTYEELVDADRNGINDVFERKLTKAKPITADMIRADKKHQFWKAIKATLAGETTVGVIGREVKNVVKRFIPFGTAIDGVADEIGNLFKSKRKNTIMNKKKKENPQPSTMKGVAIVVALLALIGVNLDPVAVGTAVSGIITGVGLLVPGVIALWEIIRDD